MDFSENFKGKSVLITGSTRGIGKEVAKKFAEQGAEVYIHGRNREQTETLASDLKGLAFPADFSLPEEVERFIKEITALEKPLHVLINNAGFEENFPFEDFPMEIIDRIYRVNLYSPMKLCQGLFPLMRRAQGASIINMSSVHDSLPYPKNLPYAAMKAALKMFSETLAVEWAPYKIRVNGLSPGAILTDMNREAIEKIGKDKFSRWIAAGRVGSVREIADCCLFLASEMASYVTGTSLLADGGLSKGLLPYGRTQAMDEGVDVPDS